MSGQLIQYNAIQQKQVPIYKWTLTRYKNICQMFLDLDLFVNFQFIPFIDDNVTEPTLSPYDIFRWY